jgi:hypothetical protein
MLQIAPQMRILVAIEPVDLRKGIDGLAELCREKLSADPFSGCLFQWPLNCTQWGRRSSPVLDHSSVSPFAGQTF